jgi:hypothetical protein
MIHAAIVMIEKVAGVESVELVSTEMYRLEPEEDLTTQYGIKIGSLGVDIIINDALSGAFKTFLGYEMCEDMIAYPNGIFITQEFVDAVIHPKDTTKFITDPDYEFNILKNIDEDGNMHLPPHTGNTKTKIDTLPGYDDLKDKE